MSTNQLIDLTEEEKKIIIYLRSLDVKHLSPEEISVAISYRNIKEGNLFELPKLRISIPKMIFDIGQLDQRSSPINEEGIYYSYLFFEMMMGVITE